MTAVAAARGTTPPVLPKAKTRLDGECLRIPASARTLSGFREWAKSDELPEKLRVAFIDGEIYLDMSWEEIETHNSVKKDTDKLRKKYHQVGVKEYWLIDARGEELSFQILHWRKTGYAAAPSHEGWQRSRVFGRSFRLERTRDKRGLWRYRLQVRDG